MKKIIIGTVTVAAALAVLRRVAPVLGARAMRRCEAMVDHMPETFPPKRMMHSIEEIRQQNTRILRQLEDHPEQARTAGARA
jgi:hypothetical protein